MATPDFDSSFYRGSSSRSSQTSDFTINTPAATLSGARHFRVSTETGWPGVSVL